MPNLICFPHYTCGGLLCDILSDSFSMIDNNGGIGSFKGHIGKIGDSSTTFTEYNPQEFIDSVNLINLSRDSWIGTHCWPYQNIVQKFDNVIVITTTTYRSKIYRWSRAYHHYFAPRWQAMHGMTLIDKARETAKNYLISFDPVIAANVINLEFADVVEQTAEFASVVQGHDFDQSMERWKQLNSFLYLINFWNSFEAKIYFQAEFETQQKRHYIYNFK